MTAVSGAPDFPSCDSSIYINAHDLMRQTLFDMGEMTNYFGLMQVFTDWYKVLDNYKYIQRYIKQNNDI